MRGIKTSVKKQTKQLGKHTAKQVIGEPLEVLKTAGKQVSGQEKRTPSEKEPVIFGDSTISPQKPDEQKIKMKSRRLLEAHESELEDIRKEKVFKKLQRKIAEGEDVPVENFPELSMEQKQILNAQKEAVEKREVVQKDGEPLAEPSTKKKRGIIPGMRGMKGKVEKLKRKAEIRMPPSG